MAILRDRERVTREIAASLEVEQRRAGIDARGFLTWEGYQRQRERQMARSDHSDRDKAERLIRLRRRLANIQLNHPHPGVPLAQLVSVINGLLDLLGDEL